MKNVNSPAFRSAVSGFNKKDVNEYIARLCQHYDGLLAERETEMSVLKAQLDSANAKLSEYAAAEADAKPTEDLSEELDKANNLIAAQTEQLSLNKNEIESLNAELSAVREKLTQYSSAEDKLAQYESMTSRMGEIFMEATADAERIRSEAKFSAEALMTKTEVECRNRRVDAEARLEKYTAERKAELNRIIDETKLSMEAVMADFTRKTQNVGGSLECGLEEFKAVSTANTAE